MWKKIESSSLSQVAFAIGIGFQVIAFRLNGIQPRLEAVQVVLHAAMHGLLLDKLVL